MRAKIFKIDGCETCKEVLLTIVRDDDGEDSVLILAWHNKDDGWYMQSQNVYFTESVLLEQYINDFSVTSATEFAKAMVF